MASTVTVLALPPGQGKLFPSSLSAHQCLRPSPAATGTVLVRLPVARLSCRRSHHFKIDQAGWLAGCCVGQRSEKGNDQRLGGKAQLFICRIRASVTKPRISFRHMCPIPSICSQTGSKEVIPIEIITFFAGSSTHTALTFSRVLKYET